MSYKRARTPKKYDGTEITTRKLSDVLPSVLTTIHNQHKERPDLILIFWAEAIGPAMAPFAQAVSFQEGILNVKVTNSSLLALLRTHEKPRLLAILRKRFPQAVLSDIHFRIG